MQAPRHVTTYTGFLSSRHIETGISEGKTLEELDKYLYTRYVFVSNVNY